VTSRCPCTAPMRSQGRHAAHGSPGAAARAARAACAGAAAAGRAAQQAPAAGRARRGGPPRAQAREVEQLVGAFDLDPNRVLDLVLGAAAAAGAPGPLLALLRLFAPDARLHVLGFRFQAHAGGGGPPTPPALFRVAAAAVQARRRGRPRPALVPAACFGVAGLTEWKGKPRGRVGGPGGLDMPDINLPRPCTRLASARGRAGGPGGPGGAGRAPRARGRRAARRRQGGRRRARGRGGQDRQGRAHRAGRRQGAPPAGRGAARVPCPRVAS